MFLADNPVPRAPGTARTRHQSRKAERTAMGPSTGKHNTQHASAAAAAGPERGPSQPHGVGRGQGPAPFPGASRSSHEALTPGVSLGALRDETSPRFSLTGTRPPRHFISHSVCFKQGTPYEQWAGRSQPMGVPLLGQRPPHHTHRFPNDGAWMILLPRAFCRLAHNSPAQGTGWSLGCLGAIGRRGACSGRRAGGRWMPSAGA